MPFWEPLQISLHCQRVESLGPYFGMISLLKLVVQLINELKCTRCGKIK